MGRKRKPIKERYGRLLVLHEDPVVKCKWICQCDCGVIKSIASSSLRHGCSKSCGCYNLDVLNKRLTTHGQSRTKTYQTWGRMLSRCRNKNIPRYKNYGGRGIKVCERWLSFENFLSDMGINPEGMSLERIDNDGNYKPSNCKWATPSEQANNRRSNTYLIIMGISYTRAEASKQFNINYGTLKSRIRRGWEPHDAVFTPIMENRNARIK